MSSERIKTLLNYSKKELAEKCAMLEHKLSVSKERFEVQYQNFNNLLEDMNMLNNEFKKVSKLRSVPNGE